MTDSISFQILKKRSLCRRCFKIVSGFSLWDRQVVSEGDPVRTGTLGKQRGRFWKRALGCSVQLRPLPCFLLVVKGGGRKKTNEDVITFFITLHRRKWHCSLALSKKRNKKRHGFLRPWSATSAVGRSVRRNQSGENRKRVGADPFRPPAAPQRLEPPHRAALRASLTSRTRARAGGSPVARAEMKTDRFIFILD